MIHYDKVILARQQAISQALGTLQEALNREREPLRKLRLNVPRLEGFLEDIAGAFAQLAQREWEEYEAASYDGEQPDGTWR